MTGGKYKEWLEPDGLLRIEAWARDGLRIRREQIAHNMGIRVETLRVWVSTHPTISTALKRGKEVIDIQVENAMCKRALGYEYEEVKTIIEQTADGSRKTKVEKTKKQVAPDVGAQIFWLKNRRRQLWMENPHKVINDNELLELKKKELESKEWP